jgi:hypothetical protein
MFRLDAATVLLQWAGGGLLFLWVTTRRREVGIGYGWLLRGTYGLMAVGALWAGVAFEPVPVRDVASALVAVATFVALGVSIVRRRAGVAGQRVEAERKRARVAAMVGEQGDNPSGLAETGIERADQEFDGESPEFPPWLDLVAPAIALVGLVAGGIDAAAGSTGAGDSALSVARILAGAVFLGSVSDAMLLGHWYLVQPGLPRAPLLELVKLTGLSWPFEVGLLLVPVGMVSVWNGTIDDGYGGMLGWFWAASAVTTLVLVFVTRAALKERYYSAVMAATGLLYLAILTAFGTDLVARAVLAG